MCGRFEQSETRRYYANALGVDTSEHSWEYGDHIAHYNIALGLCPWMITLNNGEIELIGMTWGYRTPQEAADKRKHGYVQG